jgi:hypothetical protein
MSENHMIKFELEDVVKAIRKLDEVQSSDDTMEKLPHSPVHILLYNQILQFSKEELERPIKERNFQISLADILFTHRHGFFFSACIKKGAFHHLLSEESKWLLESIPNPSHQLMGAIHSIERRSHGKVFEQKPISFSDFIDTLTGRYLYVIDTEEKEKVIDLILNKYIHEKSDFFQKMVFEHMPMHDNPATAYIHIGKRLNELNLVTKNLNGYLPKLGDYPDHVNDFRFGQQNLAKIGNLLKCGFKFDEQSYSYYGDNLFIAIVKSKKLDTCQTILPYLSDVTPKSGGYLEQHAFIDSLEKIYPKDYKFIESQYAKCLLDLELSHKEDLKVKKVKI